MADIDSLQIKISTAADGATSGIDKLISKLKSLDSTSDKRGKGLENLAQKLRLFSQSASGISEESVGKIERLANAVGKLTEANMGKSAKGMDRLAASMQKAERYAEKGKNSFGDLYLKIKASLASMAGITSRIGSFIDKSNAYIENMNLFNASMGQYAEKAREYAETVGSIVGIDPSEWMRSQGVFMTLATGFGVASDRASVMSQNLVQLGYDISSFYNTDITKAMTALQSAFSGELEPVRRLGYDLSQAKLQAEAAELGITKAFSAMTQAEKAQLRYYAIMTQVTTVQGDMARTLDAPANQLRVLKAQTEQAARAIGNMFIPALNAILPPAIAAVRAVTMVVSAFASLFGFTMPTVDYSGINGATASVDNLDDSLKGAGGSAKKLQSILMGFDEINQLKDSAGGGGGGGSVDNLLGDNWNWELPTYDFLNGLVDTRANAILERWKPVIDWAQTHAEGILATLSAIGSAILTWRIAKNFLPELTLISKEISGIRNVAVGLATIAMTIFLTYNFDKKFFQSGNGSWLVADMFASLFGSYTIAKLIKGTPLSGYALPITMTISAATTLVATFKDVMANGWDSDTVKALIVAGIKNAISGAVLGFKIGGPVGAAIGAGVGLVVTAFAGLSIRVTKASVDAFALNWGNAKMTPSEVQTYVDSLFGFDTTARVKVTSGTVEGWASAKQNLNTSLLRFQATLNKVHVGIALAPGAYTSLAADASSLAEQVTATLQKQNEVVNVGFMLVPATDEKGNDISLSFLNPYDESSSQIASAVDGWGKKLAELYTKGIETGLDEGEQKMVLELTDWINRVASAATGAQITAQAKIDLNNLFMNADADAFGAVASGVQTTMTELESQYRALIEAEQLAYATQVEMQREYVGTLDSKSGEYREAMRTLEALETQLALYDVEARVSAKSNEFIASVLPSVMAKSAHILSGAANELLYDNADFTIGDFYFGMESFFNRMPKEERKAFEALQSTLGLSQLDMFGEQFKKDLTERYASQLTDAIKDGSESVERVVAAGLVNSETVGIDIMELMFQIDPNGTFNNRTKAEILNRLRVTEGEIEANRIATTLGWDITLADDIPYIHASENLSKKVSDRIGKLAEEFVKWPDKKSSVDTIVTEVNGMLQTAFNFLSKEDRRYILDMNGKLGLANIDSVSPEVQKQIYDMLVNAVGKANANAAAKALGLSIGKTIGNNVSEGMSGVKLPTIKAKIEAATQKITMNGVIQKLLTPVAKVSMYAKGGYPDKGDLFVANENGAELVGRIGSKNAVANQDQIGDAIFQYMDAHDNSNGIDEDRLASAIVRGMKSAGFGRITIGNRDVVNAVNDESRRTGRPALQW